MKTNQQGFDIIIPVYNEGKNIIKLIKYLLNSSKNISNIYICFDFDNDSSVIAIKNSKYANNKNIILLKNLHSGPCEAVKTGFYHSKSKVVVMYPADDLNNGLLLDKMYEYFLNGYDVICPSRFMKGGIMKNCPLLKSILVRIVSFTLYYFARIKTKDPTNGFRMFSRKLLNNVSIKSNEGFAYSIELLVKAKHLNLNIIEVPSIWIEREDRKSSFKIIKWSKSYIKWYLLAFFR